MQDEINTETADSVENTAITEEVAPVAEPVSETKSISSNMSAEDFISSRLGDETSPKDEVEDNSKTTGQAVPEVDEEANANVLSQVDLDDMTEGELQELSQKLGSRAVKRFGELTAKRKAAEERIQVLESQLQKKAKKSVSVSDIDQNPYKDLKNIKEVQEKSKEIKDAIEWAENVLFESDDYSANDKVTEMDGKAVTKKEVRNILKNARKAQTRHIPQKVQDLKNQVEGKKTQNALQEKIRQEIPWAAEKDNATNQRYQSMLKDKRLTNALENADPSLKAQMPYLLAHAANSIFGERKLVDQAVKPSKSLNPPKSVSNTAVKSEKPTNRRSKNIQTSKNSFRSTGAANDFIKLRTAQLSR
jgi:hypothetical protein|tara:strand:- start:405 stop:1487 length:1083 start_codon:yes stop_codon:yes gene_type:complete